MVYISHYGKFFFFSILSVRSLYRALHKETLYGEWGIILDIALVLDYPLLSNGHSEQSIQNIGDNLPLVKITVCSSTTLLSTVKVQLGSQSVNCVGYYKEKSDENFHSKDVWPKVQIHNIK